MRIAVVTIFPALVEGVLTQSILGRAARDEAVHYEVIDVRRFADDPRRSVDDTPFGGGGDGAEARALRGGSACG